MNKNKRIGIYPGTFDPITFGHIDIINRSLKIVDKLIIGIANNDNKVPLLSISNRQKLIKAEIYNLTQNIETMTTMIESLNANEDSISDKVLSSHSMLNKT